MIWVQNPLQHPISTTNTLYGSVEIVRLANLRYKLVVGTITKGGAFGGRGHRWHNVHKDDVEVSHGDVCEDNSEEESMDWMIPSGQAHGVDVLSVFW